MNPLTDEWISKAEGDFHTAQRELAAVKAPNYDSACFHAQQCAEKYLKARLAEAEIDFPKTHDLAAILDLALAVEPDWEGMRDELDSLSNCAAEVRYPGVSSDRGDGKGALKIARKVRRAVRQALGLA